MRALARRYYRGYTRRGRHHFYRKPLFGGYLRAPMITATVNAVLFVVLIMGMGTAIKP